MALLCTPDQRYVLFVMSYPVKVAIFAMNAQRCYFIYVQKGQPFLPFTFSTIDYVGVYPLQLLNWIFFVIFSEKLCWIDAGSQDLSG